jgi:hypothetical protein
MAALVAGRVGVHYTVLSRPAVGCRDRSPDLARWTGALGAVPSGGNDLLTPEQTDAIVAAVERLLGDRDGEVTLAIGPSARGRTPERPSRGRSQRAVRPLPLA